MSCEPRLRPTLVAGFVALLLVSGAARLPAAGARAAGDRAGLEPDALADAPAAVPLPVVGGVVRATLIARETEIPPGESDPVSALNAPFTNALGQVGFTGALATPAGSDNFVWRDDGIGWRNSDETVAVLTGGESTMGISDAGGFVYSPAVDGDDAVWTHNGALLVEGEPAPGFPPPAVSTFNSRPHMVATGQAYWVGGVSTTGGTTTDARALLTSPTATAGDVQAVLRSGDVIGGFTIAGGSSGIDFDYDFSSDGAHHVQVLIMATGSTANDAFLYVDGALVARESEPTGAGDNWANFDAVGIDTQGHYLFSGDTDGATTSDEFIAADGTIAIREGDTLGNGVTLATPASVAALSLADDGEMVHLWTIAGGIELLFHACTAALLPASTPVLRTGDLVDLDGDGVGDATVTGFNASAAVGPGLDLATDGRVFVEVALDDGGGAEDAVIALALPLCMPFLDGFESGDTSRWTNTVAP